MNLFNYPHEWCGLPRFVIKLETSLLNWIFVSKANYTRTNCQQSSNVDRPRRQSWVVRANSNQRPRQNIWTRAGFASRSLNWPLPFRPIWGHGTTGWFNRRRMLRQVFARRTATAVWRQVRTREREKKENSFERNWAGATLLFNNKWEWVASVGGMAVFHRLH